MRFISFITVVFSFVAVSTTQMGCVTTRQSPAANIETAPAPMLNSERIKQKFGSYGVKVLESPSPSQRISCLFSTDGGKEICRTFAITTFESPIDPSLSEGHRLIVEKNQSIGSTFKDLGWALHKENLYVGIVEPKSRCLFQLMGNTVPQPLAIHIYRLTLTKGEKSDVPYAVIAEIHHPDYLSRDELRSIYGKVKTLRDLESVWSSIYAAADNLNCH